MAGQGYRNIVLYGGSWKVRWSARLFILIAVIIAGFVIPYTHQVGGECRILPLAERGIRSQVDGEVSAVYVDEGDEVGTGDLIVKLQSRNEEAAVVTTQAALDEAQAELDLLRNGTRPEEIAMAEQKVELWETQIDFASLTLEREKKLSAANAGAAKQVELAQKQVELGEAELLSSQQNLEKLKNGSREEEIRAAAAKVRRYAAELAHHQEKVDLTEIKTPLSGRIVTSNIRERVSQTVKEGDLIAIVHDASVLRAELAAEERAASCVRPGMPVQIRLYGVDGRLITGKVTDIARRAVDNGQFAQERIRSDEENWAEEIAHKDDAYHITVYIELDAHQEEILPGLTGYGKVEIGPDNLWNAMWRPIQRFFLVEVWSWLP